MTWRECEHCNHAESFNEISTPRLPSSSSSQRFSLCAYKCVAGVAAAAASVLKMHRRQTQCASVFRFRYLSHGSQTTKPEENEPRKLPPACGRSAARDFLRLLGCNILLQSAGAQTGGGGVGRATSPENGDSDAVCIVWNGTRVGRPFSFPVHCARLLSSTDLMAWNGD